MRPNNLNPVIDFHDESISEDSKVMNAGPPKHFRQNEERERSRRENLANLRMIDQFLSLPIVYDCSVKSHENEISRGLSEMEFLRTIPTVIKNLNRGRRENKVPQGSKFQFSGPDDYTREDDNDSLICDMPMDDPLSEECDPVEEEMEPNYDRIFVDHSYSKPVDRYDLTCELCDKAEIVKYTSDDLLIKHIAMYHGKSPKTYICQLCDKTFIAKILLKRHMEHHPLAEKKPISCDICEERFSRDRKLMIHLYAFHVMSKTSSICLFCCKRTRNVYQMREHEVESHSQKLSYACDRCDEKYSHQTLLDTHRNCHTSNPDEHFSCTVCDESFTKDYLLSHHLLFHLQGRSKITKFEKSLLPPPPKKKRIRGPNKGPRKYTCKYESCGQLFYSRADFLSHKEEAGHYNPDEPISAYLLGTRSKKCEFCSLTLNTSLIKHIFKMHESKAKPEEKTLNCPKCEKTFMSTILLRRHTARHTLDPSKFIFCEICDQKFTKGREQYLEEHVNRMHTKDPTVWCKICRRGFLKLSGLKQHEYTHPELLIHSCPICDKRYTNKAFLEIHMTTHSAQGPWICTHCGNKKRGKRGAFSSPELLAAHLDSHTGEKGTARGKQCPECPLMFQRSGGSYYTHMCNAHGHPKRHKCHMCDRRFPIRSLLLRHLATSHPDPSQQSASFLCDQCGKSFPNWRYLHNHDYFVHKKKGSTVKCKECGIVLPKRHLINAHMKSEHPEVPFRPRGARNKCTARKRKQTRQT